MALPGDYVYNDSQYDYRTQPQTGTAWYEDLFNFAKQNPEITGAVIGGALGGKKGAVIGAGLGYGASNFAPDTFGGGAYSLPRLTQGTYGSLGIPGLPTQGPYIPAYQGTGPIGNYDLAAGGGADGRAGGLTATGHVGTWAGNADGPGLNASQFVAPTGGGNAGRTGDFGSGIEGTLGRVEQWGKQNPRAASALSQGVGLIANYYGQQKANKLMQQQLDLQRQSLEQANQQLAKNNQQADFWNQQAQQSAGEARSLFNPQEMGIRGMAQQQALTARNADKTYQDAIRRGMSPQDAQAEARRVRVGGAANATTGFMEGYDKGRVGMTGALSSAKGLQSQYGGVQQYSPSSAVADYYARQAGANADNYSELINYYLGRPDTALAEQRRQQKAKTALG